MRSRRQLLGQVGLAAAGLFGLGQVGALSISPARGQGKSSAPFRILRARAGATLSGSEEKASGSLLGYDGAVPGPVLRAKHGEEIRLRLFNELAEATSLHCHGVRLPNAMDGVPDLTQSALVPGAHFDYQLLPPDAGTFWYHAHSAGQVDRGLYGALVVEERSPVDVDREIVLVLGMPDPGQSQPREHVLVNGAVRPDIALQSGERVRLRLINATAARGTTLRIDGHVPWIMAIDGQPAEPFLPRDNRVGIAPGAVSICSSMRPQIREPWLRS
jgi:FtsP/CotA-like multicopper oxidase with cupredoxin domain